MKNKIKFNTIEELQKKFPVGSIYSSHLLTEVRYFYTPTDFGILMKEYDKILNIEDNSCTCQKIIYNKVEGYIFDGEYWRPAIQTWDGWLPIDETDCEIYEGGLLDGAN